MQLAARVLVLKEELRKSFWSFCLEIFAGRRRNGGVRMISWHDGPRGYAENILRIVRSAHDLS